MGGGRGVDFTPPPLGFWTLEPSILIWQVPALGAIYCNYKIQFGWKFKSSKLKDILNDVKSNYAFSISALIAEKYHLWSQKLVIFWKICIFKWSKNFDLSLDFDFWDTLWNFSFTIQLRIDLLFRLWVDLSQKGGGVKSR